VFGFIDNGKKEEGRRKKEEGRRKKEKRGIMKQPIPKSPYFGYASLQIPNSQ
jgi:hypothetical protein